MSKITSALKFMTTLALTGLAGACGSRQDIAPEGKTVEAQDIMAIYNLGQLVGISANKLAFGRYQSEEEIANSYKNAFPKEGMLFNMLGKVTTADSADVILRFNNNPDVTTYCHGQRVVDAKETSIQFVKPVEATDGSKVSKITTNFADNVALIYPSDPMLQNKSTTLYLRFIKDKELSDALKHHAFFTRPTREEDYFAKAPLVAKDVNQFRNN